MGRSKWASSRDFVANSSFAGFWQHISSPALPHTHTHTHSNSTHTHMHRHTITHPHTHTNNAACMITHTCLLMQPRYQSTFEQNAEHLRLEKRVNAAYCDTIIYNDHDSCIMNSPGEVLGAACRLEGTCTMPQSSIGKQSRVWLCICRQLTARSGPARREILLVL